MDTSLEQQNNRRIAKNTLLLYIRMLFIMTINLYTSRVALQILGVEDFGIYNVVGGVVTLFSFLSSAMTSSTQRYITFEIGRGDDEQLKKVFATSVQIHLLLAILIAILAETVGLWFLCEKMVIPVARHDAAMWVFHLSVLTTVIAIMSYPYNAVIIAHERMAAFAYISIVEVVLKLAAVYLLLLGDVDKLILYAILIAVIQLLVRVIYSVYCTMRFPETKTKFVKDKPLFKEMFFFAGWNLWGNIAAILYSQGLNILLNMFFGPAINAARAIAVQVQNAIHQFSNSFQTALNPQIVKGYATRDLDRMHKLIVSSSKITFCLLFVLCLPILMETQAILELWLKDVPDSTAIFTRLIIVCMIIDAMANPLMISAMSTGKVKKYQSIIGGILITIVPISYAVLKMGGAPWSVFVVHLTICCVAFVVRLFIIKPMIEMKVSFFFQKVFLRCFFVMILSMIIPLFFKWYLAPSLKISLIVMILSFACAAFFCIFIGLDKSERQVVLNKIPFMKRSVNR